MLADRLVFDALRERLIEIGEAVSDIDPELLVHGPDVPWVDVERMRDHFAHRCFDTDHEIVTATVDRDLPPLLAAVQRLKAVERPGSGPWSVIRRRLHWGFRRLPVS